MLPISNRDTTMIIRHVIAGIAALFLATGAANAAEGDFNCDRLPKYYLGGHFSKERTTKDATLTFEVGFPDNQERYLPSDERAGLGNLYRTISGVSA
jgi:hypothetical protein